MGNEVSTEVKKSSVVADNLSVIATPEGFQKYILGTKKNGNPRALYDVVKDYTKPKKKKKKKKKKNPNSSYDLYLTSKKKKKKKKKHWHI